MTSTWTSILLWQIVPILILIFLYFKRKFSFWSSRGVTGPRPSFPFGNILDYYWDSVGQTRLEKEWQKKHGKIYGYYLGTRPVLSISDSDLIKQVLVKDFQHFVNRDVAPFDHDIWSKNLFNSEDEVWRRIRAITSPTFSTGKLRGMHGLMNSCVDKLGDYFDSTIKSQNGLINAKKVVTGFTIDVIASTSFATETNANGAQREGNPFLEHGSQLINLTPTQLIVYYFAPGFVKKWLGYSTGFYDEHFNFFVDLSKEIVKQRRDEGRIGGKKRNDLVQLLMDAFVLEEDLKGADYEKLTASAENESTESQQNGHNPSSSSKKTLSENEIIAQCIIFFVAGFETTATTISNALYHLAIYPEVQDRLRSELSALDGKTPEEYYDSVINHQPYLEGVIKETLRMCPPLPRLQRRLGSEKGYKLAGIPLEKDQQVDICTYAVHYNPDYYPEPEKFNPDRFLPENKGSLVPYTYLPFGAGPRNCIGLRFAYQEIKLCLAKIVQQYRFEPTNETQIPLPYSKMDLLIVQDIPLRVCRV